MNKFEIIITCEHGGNKVPEKYSPLFNGAVEVLASHEGWDPGAWEVASFLGDKLKITPIGCHTSRLLIEANRSLDSHQLFSRYSNALPDHEKRKLIDEIYIPYRQPIEQLLRESKKPVLHLSIHSFTPIFNGEKRLVDIGLLFDPNREMETRFCKQYQSSLFHYLPEFKIKFNEPYRGTDDGFTTYLRTLFKDKEYLGIEIEINQKFISDLNPVKENLLYGLNKVLEQTFF